MKKRTGIMLLVGFLMIIAGVSLYLIGFFGGGSRSVYLTRDGIVVPKEVKAEAYSADLTEFNSLVINSGNADVEVVEGTGYNFSFTPGGSHYFAKDGEDTVNPADMATVENGVLHISYPGLPPLSSEGIQLGVADWGAYGQDRIVVTVPAGTVLESISTENEKDSDQIILRGVSAKKADLSSGYGSLSVVGGQFDELNLGASSGDISLYESVEVSGATTIDVDYGNVYISDATFNKLDVSNSSGDIDISRITVSEATTIKNSYGNVTLEEVTLQKGVTVKESSGDVTIFGALHGTTNVDNSYGNIDVRTTLDEGTYIINAKTSYGTVYANGAEQGTSVERVNAGAANAMNFKNSSGDITIFTSASIPGDGTAPEAPDAPEAP